MAQFRIFLLGPLKVVAPNGEDVTPTGAKAQALIALLALPPGRMWSRSALQDKLWSDRPPKHGRDSLKKEIAKIRKTFHCEDTDALFVSGMLMRLSESLVRVDIYDTSLRSEHAGPLLPELLEGCDVRDPEFEDWLRECRSKLHEPSDHHVPSIRFDRSISSREPRLKVAVLPVVVGPGKLDLSLLADMVADRMAVSLRQMDLFDIIDFREEPTVGVGRGADITLRIKALMLGDDLAISSVVHEAGSHRLVWADRRLLKFANLGAHELACLVAQFLDQMISAILENSKLPNVEQRSATRFALDAIDLMFRMKKPSIDGASRAIRRAIEIEPRGPFLALFAFNSVFRLEETKGRNTRELRELTDDLVAKALEADPFNPFSRSLLTHVYSFMFRDFSQAEQMIAPLAASPPDSPFYYHALAALYLYTGRLEEARKAARRCKEMSRFSAYHYAFATTIAAVDTVDNRIEDAIRHGEEVLAMHRGADRIYEPALRYLAAAYGLKGDVANARRVAGLITAQSPDFSIQSLKDHSYPVPSDLTRKVLQRGLLKARI